MINYRARNQEPIPGFAYQESAMAALSYIEVSLCADTAIAIYSVDTADKLVYGLPFHFPGEAYHKSEANQISGNAGKEP